MTVPFPEKGNSGGEDVCRKGENTSFTFGYNICEFPIIYKRCPVNSNLVYTNLYSSGEKSELDI